MDLGKLTMEPHAGPKWPHAERIHEDLHMGMKRALDVPASHYEIDLERGLHPPRW
jgi:hypothetical protein